MALMTSYPNLSAEAPYPGILARRGAPYDADTYAPSGAVAQVDTLTVNAGAATVGPISITDEWGRATSISGSSDVTSATTTAASLLALLQADEVANATYSFSQAAGVLTLTARRPAASITLSSGDGNVAAASVTAASSAPQIVFGAIVAEYLASGVPQPNRCARPDASALTAQVSTGTPTAANSTVYAIQITLLDRPDLPPYALSITSDGSATAAEIVAALLAAVNAAVPAGTVLASGTDTLILTSEVPGERFAVVNLGPGVIAFAATTAAVSARLLGPALRDLTQEQSGSGAPQYGPNDGVAVYKGRDPVWALCDAAASFAGGERVFVRQVAAGAERLGAIRQTNDSGDCRLLSGWRAVGAHTDLNANGTTLRLVRIQPE